MQGKFVIVSEFVVRNRLILSNISETHNSNHDIVNLYLQ